MRKDQFAPDDRLQREIWALALLLLSILLALSFVPPTLIGEAGSRLFPTGNIVGRVGALISRGAWELFGIAAFLIPLLPAVWAAGVLERIGRPSTARLSVLVFGSLILIPTGIFAFSRPAAAAPASAGWLGAIIGDPLSTGLGWVGTGLLVSFLLVALCVGTLGWNPIRTLARGSARAWMGSRQAAGVVGGAVARFRADRGTVLAGGAEPGLSEAPATVDLLDAGDGPYEDETVLQSTKAPASAPRRRNAEPAHAPLPDSGDPTSPDLPNTTLLTSAPPRDDAKNRRLLEGLGQVLIEKLATFKIEGEIVGTTTGPVVTQFEVSPAPGVKVARIANLEADLALAMRAPSVRIVAPIPGKAAVGVEVPNPEPEMVYFREIIEAPAFRNSRAQLPLALGKDISGQPYTADLARMPHLLIAGATGSGKSVCINTIITSLVFRHSPQSLRLLMIDPKMVELSVYNDLPHLRHPVVTDNNEAAGVLKWAVMEMEWRYGLLSANNVRNLQDFNRRVTDGQLIRAPEPQAEEGDPERWVYKGGALPFIVLIIDELADLMMTVQGEVEKPLALLAQKARAIGIHLILATQRPSVNVITGLIKANFPSRIAFRVASKVDSRTILDQNGADSLLGNGDMLFLPPGQSDPLRLQGAYLSTEETEALMSWYRERMRERAEETQAEADLAGVRAEPDILDLVKAREGAGEESSVADEALEDRDKLFMEAAELCIQHQGGSTSLLQRRLRIGYGRAARIIDQLHHAGVLGPADGSKPREVLMDFGQLEQLYPDG
ncbi:MAG: DNA translocase FtsK 4TM domain-containing protein [Gemmatimonadota bacterium]